MGVGALRQEQTRFDTSAVVEALELKQAKMAAETRSSTETWARVAISLGVYPSVLSAIRSGDRQPGPTLLRRLGLRRVVSYERVEER